MAGFVVKGPRGRSCQIHTVSPFTGIESTRLMLDGSHRCGPAWMIPSPSPLTWVEQSLSDLCDPRGRRCLILDLSCLSDMLIQQWQLSRAMVDLCLVMFLSIRPIVFGSVLSPCPFSHFAYMCILDGPVLYTVEDGAALTDGDPPARDADIRGANLSGNCWTLDPWF